MSAKRKLAFLTTTEAKEGPEGIFRRSLSYNDEAMTCHFLLSEGASIPLHHHPAVQNGYVLRGKIRFLRGRAGSDSKETADAADRVESSFIAEAGTSYIFDSQEPHGAEVIEEAEVIEFFTPMRPEYR